MEKFRKELEKNEISFKSGILSMPDRSTDNEDALEIEDPVIAKQNETLGA